MKFTMQHLALSLVLFTAADALTCKVGTQDGKEAWGPKCSTDKHALMCYIDAPTDKKPSAGCLPKQYASSVAFSGTDPGCAKGGGCWCFTDDCNTKEWLTKFMKTYKPPPMCWAGIAGANPGATCGNSALYASNEYVQTRCDPRARSKTCLENNKALGQGDGCPENKDKASCDAKKGEKPRDLKDSYEGTSHCIWFPEKNKAQKTANCDKDDKCKFNANSGMFKDNVHEGMCEPSTKANTDNAAWDKKKGLQCKQRVKFGCFENNAWMGENDGCKSQKASAGCLGVTALGQATCSGTCSGTATSGKVCNLRTSSVDECTPKGSSSGCSWKAQCCQWIAKPADLTVACANVGKGTMDGMCKFNNGNGPPGGDIVKLGFEHSAFSKSARFQTACGLVASFRNGKGSATVLGADSADMIATACKEPKAWEALAEHIGHTKDTIKEYCTNFIPDTTVMAAFKKHSPSYIIAKAEQGQFDAIFPGLAGKLFIVTAKPEFGKCLFTTDQGKFGAAICTCDKAECNGAKALNLIVDPAKGPMRLLQFIDGSLKGMASSINALIPGMLDANGNMDPTKVGKITEEQVVKLMKVDGMSAKTTKEELWGIVKDYQNVQKAEAEYKAGLPSGVKAIKIAPDKVKAANAAAGVPLYGKDGVVNTAVLQTLPADKRKDVAAAAGLTEAAISKGVAQAGNSEKGIASDPVVTSKGNIEVKMSTAQATLLTKEPVKAKKVFAGAIAKTLGLPAKAVKITAIYLDGKKVGSRRLTRKGSRRLAGESTVKFDWEVKTSAPVKAAAMNADSLKTNIQNEAKAVGVTVAITAAPAVTVAAPPAASASSARAASNGFLAAFFLVCILLGQK